MKIAIIRVMSLLLLVSVFLSVSVCAGAVPLELNIEPAEELEVCASDLVVPDIRDEGTVLPKLFSVTANAVYDLLATRSAGKYFTKSSMADLGGTHIRFSGELTNSDNSGNTIEIGICYYDSLHGIFESVWSQTVTSGQYIIVDGYSANISDLSVTSSMHCYIYIKNLTSDGNSYVSGNLNVYYSCE